VVVPLSLDTIPFALSCILYILGTYVTNLFSTRLLRFHIHSFAVCSGSYRRWAMSIEHREAAVGINPNLNQRAILVRRLPRWHNLGR
jgi:hypothetical protein